MELNGRPTDLAALRPLALTGYGHFTSMRVDDQRVRGLALHLERLERDCRAVFGAHLDMQQTRTYIRRAITQQDGSFIIRVTVFDPALEMGHPSSSATPAVLVTTRRAEPLPLPPLRVKSIPYVRDFPSVKHIGLFGALHARRAAQLDGYSDALFYGPDALVSEGPTWNVGFIDAEGNIVWPKGEVLPGVTMALLQRQHDHVTAPVPVDAARAMQAAFATNTSIGIRAVSAIDDVALPTEHPVLAAMRDSYLSQPGERV
ncbi:aminotransferase class IV family protein [Streptomyces sp. NPDC057654]|uniref:aminotransferase class IV family protein n=1 Tax=Streptomyces sp. NPDC057654 TaxID=3346196 RepID=UPI003693D1E9